MYEEGSAGSQYDREKLKEESKSVEEAIKEGIKKASDTSIQSHEETVFQFAPTDRGRFNKEQSTRLRSKKIVDNFNR